MRLVTVGPALIPEHANAIVEGEPQAAALTFVAVVSRHIVQPADAEIVCASQARHEFHLIVIVAPAVVQRPDAVVSGTSLTVPYPLVMVAAGQVHQHSQTVPVA